MNPPPIDCFMPALQPFGKIPAIEDGDVSIFESRAIMRYLVSTFTPTAVSAVILGRPCAVFCKHATCWTQSWAVCSPMSALQADKYDTDNKLTGSTEKARALVNQWLEVR
jgi:hypothetical protein